MALRFAAPTVVLERQGVHLELDPAVVERVRTELRRVAALWVTGKTSTSACSAHCGSQLC